MKKKKIAIVLILCMVMIAAGCGDKTGEESLTASSESVKTEKTETAEETETMQSALNVEGDSFTMDELISKAGAEEADIWKLLDTDKKADSYETKMFGEDTVVTLSVEDNMVNTITLTFEKTDPELLINAVAEQLGQDGEKADHSTKWICDDSVITLTQTDTGCVMEIHK